MFQKKKAKIKELFYRFSGADFRLNICIAQCFFAEPAQRDPAVAAGTLAMMVATGVLALPVILLPIRTPGVSYVQREPSVVCTA